MRALKLTIALIFAVFLGGCVPSLYPLYTDKDIITNDAIIGTWMEKDTPEETWVFKQGEKKSYDLTVTIEEEPAEFTAYLVKLGDTVFIDTFPKGGEGVTPNAFFLMHVLPAHIFMKIDLKGDVLNASMFDPEWMKNMMGYGKIKLAHEKVNGDIFITAPTKALHPVVLKYANDKKAFVTEPIELHRHK